MKNNRKSVISVLLVLCMLVGMLSVSVSAVEGDGAYVAYQQVLLGDDLTMQFYIVVEDGYEDAVLTVTALGEQTQYTISEMTPVDGYYVISVEMAAAQMTEEIALYMTGAAGELINSSYSVRNYALALINGDYSDEIKALAAQLLNYGAMAQTYFGYKTDAMANEGVTVTAATVPTEGAAMSVSGRISGVKFYGATLVLKGKIAVRYYFKATDGVDGCSFAVGDTTYEAKEKNGLYYVEIPNIAPDAYSDDITVTATSGDETLSVTYSPLCYIIRMSNSESSTTALKDLLAGMYGYHQAAVSYVAAIEDETTTETEDGSQVPEVEEPVDIVLVTVPTDDWNN